MDRYTILHINPFSFPSLIGGVDIVLLQLAEGLDADRFRSIIVLPRDGPLTLEYRKVADKVIFANTGTMTKTRNVLAVSKFIPNMMLSAIDITKVIKQERVDLVHTQMALVLSGDIAAKWCKVPSLHSIHNVPYSKLDEIMWRIMSTVILHLADRVTVISEDVGRTFRRNGNRPQKVVTIYNGVDTSRFQPGPNGNHVRREFQISEETRIVGIVGRLHPTKGHRYFLEAAATVRKAYPNVRFLIVGDVPVPSQAIHRGWLEAYSEALNLEEDVIFAGVRRDIPEVLAAMDIFVCASTREPFGMVVIEAMASGKPVVATRAGGIPEIIEHGVNGLLVPAKDSRAIAEAILRLLQDKKLRTDLGAAARCRIETQFTASSFVERIEQEYKMLLNGRA